MNSSRALSDSPKTSGPPPEPPSIQPKGSPSAEIKSPPSTPSKPQTSELAPLSSQRLWGAIALNWLIPGSGYFLVGDRRRAWALVALFHITFFMGLTLKGGVVFPEWNYRSETFNIISVLTFLVDMGAGWPSLASLAARHGMEPNSFVPLTGFRGWLAGDEAAAAFDLASFHILLVGALNYFACCALYDRCFPRLRKS